MSAWYDRQGNRMLFNTPEQIRAVDKLLSDRDYKVVKQDHIGGWFISTVWLGLDHSFNPHEDPLIFETMIFKSDGPRGQDHYMARYSTEEQALRGHEYALKNYEELVKGEE